MITGVIIKAIAFANVYKNRSGGAVMENELKDSKKRVSFFMDVELHRCIKVITAQNGTSMTHFIIEAVQEKLEREDKCHAEKRIVHSS